MRPIDADALSEKLCKTTIFVKDGDAFQRMINDAPTVSAETVPTGEWIPLVMNGEYKCSVCGRASKSDNAAWVNIPSAYWNYCPNCGARMFREDDEG